MSRWISPACAALLALGLGGCRPHVESEVPCGESIKDDLACPTGYHCGAEGFCDEGEPPPRLAFVRPEEGATLSGLATVSFHASCPRGLTEVSLRLEQGGTTRADLSAEPIWDTDAEALAGLFTSRLDTGTLDDGDYQLVASAKAATPAEGAVDVTELRVNVKVRR